MLSEAAPKSFKPFLSLARANAQTNGKHFKKIIVLDFHRVNNEDHQ